MYATRNSTLFRHMQSCVLIKPFSPQCIQCVQCLHVCYGISPHNGCSCALKTYVAFDIYVAYTFAEKKNLFIEKRKKF